MSLVLLVGAARSGKSDLALRMAQAWPRDVTFIATAEARDEEMAARIQRHSSQRPAEWHVIEEPVSVSSKIASVPDDHFVVLDCLTLWVSNLLEAGLDPTDVAGTASDIAKMAAAHASPVAVVTNEVGAGIVPIEPSVRAYRDLLGSVNRIFAEQAHEVLLIAAGRVLALRPAEEVIPHLLPR